MFPFFQPPGTSSGCHDLSNIMESGLTMTSANCLRTLGSISSCSIDLCIFGFLRWSRIWSSFTVGRSLAPVPHLVVHWLRRGEERSCQWKLRQKSFSVSHPSPHLLIWGCHSCSSGEYAVFNLPFVVDIPVETLLVIFRIPWQVQLQLCLGLPDSIPTQPGSYPILFPGNQSLLPLPVQCPLP